MASAVPVSSCWAVLAAEADLVHLQHAVTQVPQSEAHTSRLSQGHGLVPASCTIAHLSVTKNHLAQLESTALQLAWAVLLISLQFKMKVANVFGGFFSSLACDNRPVFEWELWIV